VMHLEALYESLLLLSLLLLLPLLFLLIGPVFQCTCFSVLFFRCATFASTFWKPSGGGLGVFGFPFFCKPVIIHPVF